jgi:pimeloyl-ACP methyl ester carboxylesterase
MPYATNPVDGTRIHYEVEGTGPSLVLHVGFLGRLQDWYRFGVVDALRDDHTLILIDPRGQGASNKPHDVDSYLIERFVEDVIAVLDSLHVDRAHFFGYSMGAQIGFAAGVFNPDRFSSLILGGCHPYFDQPATVVMPTVQEEADVLLQGMDEFVERVEQTYGKLAPERRVEWLENDNRALAANTLAMERYPDISESIQHVSLPTLLYCGTADDTFAGVQKAGQAMPNATVVALENMNHAQAFRESAHILPHVRSFLAERS